MKMWKFLCQKTAIRFPTFFQKKLKRWTLEKFLWSCEQPVRSNALQEAVGHSRLKMYCFVTLLLRSVSTTRVHGPSWRPVNSGSGNRPLGSVETQLGWCTVWILLMPLCVIHSSVRQYKKNINRPRNASVVIDTKVGVFSWTQWSRPTSWSWCRHQAVKYV